MKNTYAPKLILSTLILAAALAGCSRKSDAPVFVESKRGSGQAEPPVKDVPADTLAVQKAFSAVSKKVTPCVVNISTISKRQAQPFFEMSPFFDDFFGSPRHRREKSLGSGFIISPDGYIVTNDHVVRDAETVQVKLSNDKVYKAKVVGGDQKTDIAVIKINLTDLPVAVLGDSDKLEVGQWAIAIGNPFGLDRTMTVGIISGTGRSNMGIETYENFIQTDASINPGNSGGPLLNIYGEVIGINTAIVAAGQGIGFAIPVTMAKPVITQLINKGSVSRGYIGVTIQPVTEELARSFDLKDTKGALINDIIKGGPADKAGLHQGDVIIGINGSDVKDPAHLQLMVAQAAVGKPLKVTVIREGKNLDLTLTLAAGEVPQRSKRPPARGGEQGQLDQLGMAVDEADGEGVVVAELARDGIAAEAGIRPGDVIVTVNRKRVRTVAEYQQALSKAVRGGSLSLLVRRGDSSIYFALPLK